MCSIWMLFIPSSIPRKVNQVNRRNGFPPHDGIRYVVVVTLILELLWLVVARVSSISTNILVKMMSHVRRIDLVT